MKTPNRVRRQKIPTSVGNCGRMMRKNEQEVDHEATVDIEVSSRSFLIFFGLLHFQKEFGRKSVSTEFVMIVPTCLRLHISHHTLVRTLFLFLLERVFYVNEKVDRALWVDQKILPIIANFVRKYQVFDWAASHIFASPKILPQDSSCFSLFQKKKKKNI